jgi:hypothetical protein
VSTIHAVVQARQQEAAGDELPLTTSRALAKLLDACGLNSEFSGGKGTSHFPQSWLHLVSLSGLMTHLSARLFCRSRGVFTAAAAAHVHAICG